MIITALTNHIERKNSGRKKETKGGKKNILFDYIYALLITYRERGEGREGGKNKPGIMLNFKN